MTKIKNFRISLRVREIARLLKNQEKLQITPALEASIEHAMSDAKRLIQPAAVYTTLTRATAEKTTTLTLGEETVAVSVIAVTVGPELEKERQAALARQDTLQAALMGALQLEALAQAVQFAVRLIQDQAKEEECEMSAPLQAGEVSLVPALGALLGIQRIGIVLEPQSPLPPYARLAWTLWTPLAKRSAKRTEKAAAV